MLTVEYLCVAPFALVFEIFADDVIACLGREVPILLACRWRHGLPVNHFRSPCYLLLTRCPVRHHENHGVTCVMYANVSGNKNNNKKQKLVERCLWCLCSQEADSAQPTYVQFGALFVFAARVTASRSRLCSCIVVCFVSVNVIVIVIYHPSGLPCHLRSGQLGVLGYVLVYHWYTNGKMFSIPLVYQRGVWRIIGIPMV